MDQRQKENSTRGAAFAAIVAAVALMFAILLWGPGNVRHVESNPGPSGLAESTVKNAAPPPAGNPSEGTVGRTR
jgi:hypothetical protein